MIRWMLTFCAGVVLIGWLPKLPEHWILLPLILLFLLSLKYRFIKFFGLFYLGAFCLGAAWGLGYGMLNVQKILPGELQGQDLKVKGYVVGLPAERGRYKRFDFHLTEMRLPSGEILINQPRRLRLNWYQPTPVLATGQRWQLQVRLKRPYGFVNPGSQNYQTRLFRQGIGATGYVRRGEANLQLERAGFYQWTGTPAGRLRYVVHQLLQALVKDLHYGPVILALTLGESGDMKPEWWRFITATGTNHLFVISGLHVGFVALLGYWSGWGLLRCFPTKRQRLPLQQGAALAAIIAAGVYSLMAGFSLPTQRAFIMVSLMLSAQLLKRRSPVWQRFTLALLAVLLWDPLAAQSSGFWLSFGAVAALVAGYTGRASFGVKAGLHEESQEDRSRQIVWHSWRNKFWQNHVWPQWIVFVALAPLLMLFYHRVSLVAPFANLIAVPVTGLVVVPLCLVGTLLLVLSEPLSLLCFSLADLLIGWQFGLLESLTGIPGTSFQNVSEPLATGLVLAGVALLIMPRGLPVRHLGMVLLLPALLPAFLPALCVRTDIPGPGEFELVVYDVGQGLAVLVRTHQHQLLYDTGPRYSPRFNAADAVILPHLRSVGITKLDHVVLSHGDNDHAGALPMLLKQIPVGRLVVGDPTGLSSDIKNTVTKTAECRSSAGWQWDSVQFVLMQWRDGSSANDRSCVLWISNGEEAVLLAGDIGIKAEKALLAEFAEKLRADLLLAPHHGSLTSSSVAFINQVAPSRVIFSSGYRNPYGHPHPLVVERYRRRGTLLLKTAQHGSISYFAGVGDGVAPRLTFHRQERQRYWW